jgi:hypothetical protein
MVTATVKAMEMEVVELCLELIMDLVHEKANLQMASMHRSQESRRQL